MGGWTELSFSPVELLEIYRNMQIPSLKQHATTSIGFEDIKKEAVLAVLFIAQQLTHQAGLKIKYRGVSNIKGRRLVFASNHQGGNLDALLIASILCVEKGQVPLIPTSDRLLDVRFIGQFSEYLKYIGPFFIRSKFSDDPVYTAEVAHFMSHALDAKQSILFFPEGATSKHGKPCPFKRGLLKSLMEGGPLSICPVSITYESPLNDAGIKEEKFSPIAVMNGLLARKPSTVYITFGKCLDSTEEDDHRLLSSTLEKSICSGIPILTVDLVATILLDNPPRCALEELVRQVRWLEGCVRKKGMVYISKDIVKSLAAISHLITVIDNNVIEVTNPLSLSFYRNRSLPLFFQLIQPSALLRNECVWSVDYDDGEVDVGLAGLANRVTTPLVGVYSSLLHSLEKGVRSIKKLTTLVEPSSATSCYTLSNFLKALGAEVEGDNIVV